MCMGVRAGCAAGRSHGPGPTATEIGISRRPAGHDSTSVVVAGVQGARSPAFIVVTVTRTASGGTGTGVRSTISAVHSTMMVVSATKVAATGTVSLARNRRRWVVMPVVPAKALGAALSESAAVVSVASDPAPVRWWAAIVEGNAATSARIVSRDRTAVPSKTSITRPDVVVGCPGSPFVASVQGEGASRPGRAERGESDGQEFRVSVKVASDDLEDVTLPALAIPRVEQSGAVELRCCTSANAGHRWSLLRVGRGATSDAPA